MKWDKLDKMFKGWFIGNFDPALVKTDQFEVAVKKYKANDHESWHYHKIGTEVTLLVDGIAQMAGKRMEAGDMVMLSPGEGTDFLAETDCSTVVVKFPSVLGDKYDK